MTTMQRKLDMDAGPPLCLKAGDQILPFAEVARADISHLEQGVVTIHMKDGSSHDAHGFDAIETVMALKPSAVEGLRLRWRPHAWAFHNLVAHPVVQLLAWCGWKRAAVRFHDWTTPAPRGFRSHPAHHSGNNKQDRETA
jgi:hypothetical protein